MEYVKCNLCGADDYDTVFDAGVAQINQVVRCRHCRLMYANPRTQAPDCDQIVQWDPDFVLKHSTEGDPQRLEKEALQVRDYATTRKFLAERFPDRGTLIEIGSGLGYLLRYFKEDGWEALGIEPNVGLARYATERLGLAVKPVLLHEAQLPNDSVSAALMMHVIEHVPDPSAVVREVYRVLRPGGCFVLETPRYDTLMFRVLKHRERSISCDGHIYFFTTDSLQRLLVQNGFKIIRADPVGRSLTFDRFLYNVGVVSKSTKVKQALQRFSRSAGLERWSVSINLRDMQRVYVEKPERGGAHLNGA